MLRTTITCLLASCAALLPVGCATIASGRSEEVTFDSSPEEATVKLDGRKIGKTPITTMLQRETGQKLKFEKEGYKPQTMELSTQINPWFLGNVAILCLACSATDAVTGAIHQYSRDQYLVTLAPEGNSKGMLEPVQKVKEFVLINFKDLQKAAYQDRYYENETFVSLAQMLDIDLSNKERLGNLRDIIRNTKDSRDAAGKIQNRFLKPPHQESV